ncbi:hypothetical protein ACVXHA_03520 [Escherichia coli]
MSRTSGHNCPLSSPSARARRCHEYANCPDAATCLLALPSHNPGQRRYRYPFINCTHCGPRFTIIRAMPYDRPFTVMAAFPLRPARDKEYRDPLDCRFHAQPVACRSVARILNG